jgi:hypothetical protein
MKIGLCTELGWLAFIKSVTDRLEEEGLRIPDLEERNGHWFAKIAAGALFNIEVDAYIERVHDTNYCCSVVLRDQTDLSNDGGCIKILFVAAGHSGRITACRLHIHTERKPSAHFDELLRRIEHTGPINWDKIYVHEAMMLVRLIAIEMQKIAA